MSASGDSVRRTTGRLIYSYGGTVIGIPNTVFDDVHFQTELANFLSLPGKVDSDPPDVPAGHPEYITALLTGILRSVGHVVEGHHVLKHVRDDTRMPEEYMNLEDEWRRSSLWLLIRAAIQTSLDRSPLGQASFKSFMLFFICNLTMDAHNADFSSHMLYLMSAKILRRLSKLGSSVPRWLSDMALKTCTGLQGTLDDRAMLIRAANPPSPHWNPSELDLAGDIQLSLHCGEYIRDSVAHPDHTYVVSPFHLKDYHRGTLGDYLSSNPTLFDKSYSADPDVALYDVEKSVEQDIDDWLVDVTNFDEACTQLGTLIDKYLSRASAVYTLTRGLCDSDASLPSDEYELDEPVAYIQSMDQERYAIMGLTAFELWVSLDKLAVEEIPMLAEYSPEILIPSLELLHLRETTNLHRLSGIYQYLLGRHSKSRDGLSLPSNKFDDDSFPVRYCDTSPDLQQLKRCIEEAMGGEGGELGERRTACRTLAKVVAFELQCPEILRIWRSAVGHLLERIRDEDDLSQFDPRVRRFDRKPQPHDLLPDIPELQPFLANYPRQKSRLFQLAYFYPQWGSERRGFHYVFRADVPSYFPRPRLILDDLPEGFFTSNYVLSSQAYCPEDSSLDEYIALEHLRRAGSLRWVDILRELRSRTLDFHSRDVYDSLTDVACRAGPLDHKTGEWVWHQELQDPVFCNTLLNELERLFADVSNASLDHTPMGIISLLLTRLLASNPPEFVSGRALQLLRNIRAKTLEWVQERAYNLIQAPTSNKRRRCLRDMAVACQSTFGVGASLFREVLHSAEDVEALLSCALFTRATEDWNSSENVMQPHRRLSVAMEKVVKDVILSDVSDRGIDLAVHNIWPGYRPGPGRWQQEWRPHSHWLVSTTAETAGRQSQIVRINLLDGSLLVDGRPLGILPRDILEHPLYRKVFSRVCTDQNARRGQNVDFF